MYSALHNKSSLKVVKEGGRGGREGRGGRKEREGREGREGRQGRGSHTCCVSLHTHIYLDELAPTDFHVEFAVSFAKIIVRQKRSFFGIQTS